MTRFFPCAVLVLMLACQTTGAQEPGFTQQEDEVMTNCLENARAAMEGEAAREAPARLEDCIGAVSTPCMQTPEGMTTIGTNECMSRETAWWDGLLNANYALMRESMDDQSAIAFRDAQRAWIAFRDAECDFHYTYWREGTIRTTFYFGCLLDMTASRAIELEHMFRWEM